MSFADILCLGALIAWLVRPPWRFPSLVLLIVIVVGAGIGG